MKKLMLTILSLVMISQFTHAEPSPSLVAKFKGKFGAFSEVQWIQNKNKFIAYYKESHDITVRVFYDQNEDIESILRYYPGTKLPEKLLKNLKKDFARHEVTSVTELSNANGVNYHLTLATPRTISIVRYLDNCRDYDILDAFHNGTASNK